MGTKDKKDAEEELEFKITNYLSENGINFQKEVIVGNYSSDFFVETPSGGTAIFEVKSWDPSKENLIRANNLANIITSGSGVDTTFIVIPYLPHDINEKNIIQPSEIISRINQLISKSTSKKKIVIKQRPKKTAFAAMPFDPKYDDTFVVAMQPAAHKSNLECIRVDEDPRTGDVVDKIKNLLKESIVTIADVSDFKPNVFYEMGYSDGIGHPIIQICSTPLEQLPFDIRNNQTIPYSIGQTSKLIPKLVKYLKEIVKDFTQ